MSRARLAAAASSGLLLGAAFPPLDLGPLAVVALVPLLWAWRDATPPAAAVYGGVAGIAFFSTLVEWSRYFGAVAVVPFVLFLSSWWVLGGAVIGWLGRRGLAPAPVVASVWVLVEAGRGHLPWGGFTWGELGYALHDVGTARGLAGWGGVPLLSWTVVLINGLVLEAARSARGPRSDSRRRRPLARPLTGLVASLVMAAALAAALPGLTPTGRLRVALVQGNDRNRDLTATEIRDRYLVSNHLRLASGISAPVDLIVLPESSLDQDPRTDPSLDRALADLARGHNADVLAGGNTEAPHRRLYNTTFHWLPDGTRAPEVYRKRHLVPFGEYVPGRSALSFIKALEAVPTDYARGPGPTEFPVAGHRLGALICFESAFAPLARQYARLGSDAIVVLTNNRSYRRSANSAQHLAMGQLRAAETGRPVIQAAISGISAVIDHTGRLRDDTALFDPTVLVASVDTYRGRTPYTRFGDWMVALSALGLAAALSRLGLTAARRRAPTRAVVPGGALDSSR